MTSAAIEQAVKAAADNDPHLAELGRTLAETWANLDPGDDGFDVAAIFARAAYGNGYVRALEDGPPA